MKKILLLSLLFTHLISFAQKTDDEKMVKKISDEVLWNSKAYDNLYYLCKKIGSRLSGSEGAQKAVEATTRMLKEAGADTVYWQECMVPHWVRGEKETGYINLPGGKNYDLNLCAIGNTEGTGAKGVKAKIIEVKSLQELAQLGEKVIKGNIVFINIRMNPSYIETFNAYSEDGVGRFVGPAQAAMYGAVGVMVRSLAINIDDYPHTGTTRYNDSFPKIPAVCISTRNAEWLSSELKKNINLEGYFKTSSKMLAPAKSYNVIGEIWGSEKPEEIISVGGHLDSWDLAEGAQDDGAGCVQSIEIIRALKASGIKPKRTIRAVMFMNEENGGAGSDAYFDAAKKNKEKHIFALESDAGGFTPRGFSLEMDDVRMEKLKAWAPLFLPLGVYRFDKGHAGADIGNLRALGTALAGLSPDSQRYFDLHHASTDVFEAVSKRELELGALNMAVLVWLVSEHGL